MACQMGDQDRLSRVVAGTILVGFALISGNSIGWLGLIPLITGIIGWCPVYRQLEINTCGAEDKENHH